MNPAPFKIVHLLSQPAVRCGALCPILGIGTINHPAAGGCDIIVAEEAALAPVIANITRAPIAAMTLVQVLRATESMSVADALIVESLAYAALQGGAENAAWLQTRPPFAFPPADNEAPILLDRHDDLLTVRLNRPMALNAVNMAMRDGLAEAFSLAALDDSITRIRLTGAGRCFSVGGALEEFGTAPDQATAHAVRCATGPAFMLAPMAARSTAIVHGACIGAGAELAALCGRVVARSGAFFQLPEIKFGLIPGSGGTVGISRRIGRQLTAWLALSARRIGARQALEWGLVDAISLDDG
jgi:enoyl-CoA hydratase/carnithine racemase